MNQKPIGEGDSSLPSVARAGERYVMRLGPAARHQDRDYRAHEGQVVTVMAQEYRLQPTKVVADDGWVGHAYDDELFSVTSNPEPQDLMRFVQTAVQLATPGAIAAANELVDYDRRDQEAYEAATAAHEALMREHESLAMQACRALELAYARGDGFGSIDWADVDEARRLAQEALGPQECAAIAASAQEEAAS
jgi:hypothetical protein